MNVATASDPRAASPLRNPMVWLIVGLPLAVVVAGFATLAIAIRAGGSDAIPEEVRRTAQIQTTELAADARAAEMKLSLVLSVHDDALELLPATGDALPNAPLTLSLHHPTRADGDLVLIAQPTARGWRVAHRLDRSHDWRLVLGDEQGVWRLFARLPAGQRGVLLAPALAGDGDDIASSERGTPAFAPYPGAR